MRQVDRLVAVVPEHESITTREAARLAGMDIMAAQKAMLRLIVAGRVRREVPESFPLRYLRNPVAPRKGYVPITTVQLAKDTVPTSVWDLGRVRTAPASEACQ